MFEKKKIGDLNIQNSPEFRVNPAKSFRLRRRLKLKKSKIYNFFIWILVLFLIFFSIRLFLISIDLSFWSVSKWVINGFVNLEKDNNWFVNILLIWAWWWDHDWPKLTDTMMVVSADIINKSVVVLSIPRDFYVDYNSIYHWSRINEIYRDMSRRMENLWIDKTIASNEARWVLIKTISNILDLEISYYAQIDFQWFIEIVDSIWWIEIYNEEKILDETYPDWDWWYEVFELDEWFHSLSWETALKYARSRHSSSDFSRAARQQQIMAAIKDKLTSSNIITNPSRIKDIYDVASRFYETNLSLSQILSLAYTFRNFPTDNLYTAVLNDDYETRWGFLWTPLRSDYWWAYVLIPYAWESEYSKIHLFTDIIFKHRELSEVNIEILNSTSISWIASRVSKRLKRYWFSIESIWNHSETLKYTQINIFSSDIDVQQFTEYFEEIFPLTQINIVDKIWYYEETDIDIEIIIWNNIKF